jgi:hypothetical protein
MGFSRWGLTNYLPGLALNHDPPDLCLLSSWDYRCGPPCQASDFSFSFTDIFNKKRATLTTHAFKTKCGSQEERKGYLLHDQMM